MRTRLWTSAFALAGALGLAAGSAAAEETFNLTMQSTWPAADPMHLNFERWAEQVEYHTMGRVQIETLPAGAIVPAFELLDAVHDQVLDGAHAWSGYWVGKDRAAVMVSSGPAGPFGMDAWDWWGWYWMGGGREINDWFFQEHLGMDVVWFPVGSAGSQSFGWTNVELASAADLEGLRLRVPGIPAEMYEPLGPSIISMPGGEIVPAGERGLIDGAEYVGPYIDLRLGFHEVWKFHYAPAYHETVTVLEVMFHTDVWDAFPEDIKRIIEVVTREHHAWWEQHHQEQRHHSMNELMEHGVEFRRTPDDILEQSLEAWHDIFREEYATNEAFRRLANSQMEWASKVVVTKRILEPDYKELADFYWGPGGFVQTEDLDFEYQPPPYYEVFVEPASE